MQGAVNGVVTLPFRFAVQVLHGPVSAGRMSLRGGGPVTVTHRHALATRTLGCAW